MEVKKSMGLEMYLNQGMSLFVQNYLQQHMTAVKIKKKIRKLQTMREKGKSVSSHPALKPLLGECTMRKDLVELLCLVLSKAFRSRADRGTLQHLAGIIKDSGFLRTVLPHYLAAVSSEFDTDCRDEYPQHLDNILAILTQVLSIFPASSVESVNLLLTLLRPSLNSLRTSGVDVPPQIEKNMEHLQHLVRHLQTMSRDGTIRSKKDTYALLTSADEDQQDFRNIPIYPTPEELRHEDRPYLRPNLTSQRYPSTHLYLDTHFRLLREDFVRPLREGIQELLRAQMDNAGNHVKTKRLDDIRMYHDTKLIAPQCTMNGLAYMVQFNVQPLKFVRWENSKRLIFGSLVCLSCDNFESFLFATISNRDPKELQEGRVQIIFTEESRDKLARTQENQVYLMVETTAYFEAYRHVLEGLKEQKEDELPFKKYLVDCNPDVESPAYLRSNDTYDLSSVAHPDFKTKVKPFHCLDSQAWPTMEELGLDESQFRAFQLALTKELAIIQGPPGTGKTYVGLKIAQALLKNNNLWSTTNKAPILIVCYTNHALDQFLEGIHRFLKDGIVRVGSRSSSEILKRFNLRELSRSYDFKDTLPAHLITPYNAISREVHDAETVLEIHSVKMACTFKGLMHESVLQEFMSEQHWDCLHAVRKRCASEYVGKKLSVILEWLGLECLQATQTQDVQAEATKKPEGRLIDIDEQATLLEAERDVDDEIYFKGRRDDHKRGDMTHIMENRLLVLSAEHDDLHNGRWEYQSDQKKKLKNKIKQELRKESTMSEEEERLNPDIWTLSGPDRWRLYRLWVDRYRAKCRTEASHLEEVYQNAVERLADVKRQQDLCLLRNAKCRTKDDEISSRSRIGNNLQESDAVPFISWHLISQQLQEIHLRPEGCGKISLLQQTEATSAGLEKPSTPGPISRALGGGGSVC
uniref:NFX1-type zinc finger-containing protein 1 n=1 Tax=Knipowitschia caucasica TaxID=637954 RepID=A0AAV2M8G7_KNICA